MYYSCRLVHYAIFLCCLIVVAALQITSAQLIDNATDAQQHGIQLVRHSLDSTFQIDHAEDHWIFSGNSSRLGNKLVLLDGRQASKSILWSKTPVLTDSFDVEFDFRIYEDAPQDVPSTPSQGFALWFSPTPAITEENDEHVDKTAWDLFAHSRQFKGLAVFFSVHDRNNKVNPSISAAIDDGTREWNPGRDIPSNNGVFWTIRNSAEPLNFRLMVRPTMVSGQAKYKTQTVWADTFKLSGGLMESGYLGFSAAAMTDAEATSGDMSTDRIELEGLKMFNLNHSSVGEATRIEVESHDVARQLDGIVVEGKPALFNAVQLLSKVVMSHAIEQGNRIQSMETALTDLTRRMTSLTQGVVSLVSRMEKPTGGGDQNVVMAGVAEEIAGLKSLVHSHSRVAEKLLEVGKSMSSAPAVPVVDNKEHLNSIEKTLQKQVRAGWTMFSILLLVVIIVLAVVWKKTREIEKKHLF